MLWVLLASQESSVPIYFWAFVPTGAADCPIGLSPMTLSATALGAGARHFGQMLWLPQPTIQVAGRRHHTCFVFIFVCHISSFPASLPQFAESVLQRPPLH